MEVLKLIMSLVIFIPLAQLFHLSPEYILMGCCILFAGFIAADS